MALLSKKEFAEQCGMKTNTLSTYIGRGNVIVGENDLIDSTVDKNKAFLAKNFGKKKPEEKVAIKVKPNKPGKTSEPEGDPADVAGIPSYFQSETLLKYLDTIKREKEIAKLEIDIDKKRGVVIPSELVKPVFLRHNQSIVTEFKNATDEILRLISKKKGLSVNEVAEIKGQMVECINSAITKATNVSVKAVDDIISEHSEKRGVGERT